MNNKTGNKWNHKKYGYRVPAKFIPGSHKNTTKRNIIRQEKRQSRKRLTKYLKEAY